MIVGGHVTAVETNTLRLHNKPFTPVAESLVSDKKSSLSGRRHEPSLTLHHHALPGYIMPLE